jgi:Putative Actinobacterial Holin-X, holin superfamily III
MSVPRVDQVAERPLQELVQTASQQAVGLAREQVDAARRDLTARASQAGPGVAMVGAGALLGALASGTGTAALILLLARRLGPSAAALGVTGAYAGAGALLAREGLVRLREAGPALPEAPDRHEPVQNAEQDLGSAKRRTESAAKSPPLPDVPVQDAPRQKAKQALGSAKRGAKSAAKSKPQPTGRAKPKAKSASSRRRASGPHTDRTRPRAS